MSGQWPPEWGEPDWEDQEPDEAMANSDGTDAESAELAAVTAALASFPMPVMPESVEARIAAALAAEAASRAPREVAQTTAAAAQSTATARSAEPGAHVLDRSRPRHASARRRRLQLRSFPAAASVLVAVLIGGFVYALSQGGATSSSSEASGAAAPGAMTSASAPAFGADKSASLALPVPGLRRLSPNDQPPFVVTANGASYQTGMVNDQLRHAYPLHGSPSAGTGTGSVPSPSASSPAYSAANPPATSSSAQPQTSSSGASASVAYAPTASLVGCVLKVTGGVTPTSVEYATYNGSPVFVIVVPGHAWIVGVGCTASNPRVIATVSLTG